MMSDVANRSNLDSTDTFWEKAAGTRWGRYLSNAESAALTDAVADVVPGIALDIGCDGGRWSQSLAERGWSNICLDVRPDAVERCRKRLPHASCLLADADDSSLPVADRSVHLVVAYEVAPVTQAPWFPPEAARVLDSGGLLVCTLYNRTSARGLTYRLLTQVDTRRREINPYGDRSYSRIRADLRAHGFELLELQGLGWAPFPRLSDSWLVPCFTWLERLAGLRRLVRFSPLIIVVARRVRGTCADF
jgi:SAM-dependent methyltransferase